MAFSTNAISYEYLEKKLKRRYVELSFICVDDVTPESFVCMKIWLTTEQYKKVGECAVCWRDAVILRVNYKFTDRIFEQVGAEWKLTDFGF